MPGEMACTYSDRVGIGVGSIFLHNNPLPIHQIDALPAGARIDAPPAAARRFSGNSPPPGRPAPPTAPAW